MPVGGAQRNALPVRLTALWSLAFVGNTSKDEAFMTLLMAMTDTRKRIVVLAVLSYLAMC
jgi:hypothetical protein